MTVASQVPSGRGADTTPFRKLTGQAKMEQLFGTHVITVELTDTAQRLTGKEARQWMMSAGFQPATLLEHVLGGPGAREDGRTPRVVPAAGPGGR